MSLHASAPTKDAPRVPATWHGDGWWTFCLPCRNFHYHGGRLGPVPAGCNEVGGPYWRTGYRLAITGDPPYGYRDDGTGEGLVSDPAEEQVTWHILGLHDHDGLSAQETADTLNAKLSEWGWPALYHGRPWTAQAVDVPRPPLDRPGRR